MIKRIFHHVADLSPANFGMVMATGILSLAAHYLQWDSIAYALFYLNNGLYALLAVLITLKAWRYSRAFFLDIWSHSRGSAFFTLVAATNVLGGQYALLEQNYGVAFGLWVLGVLLWVLITYTLFTAFIIKKNKPSLRKGISGAWLLAVVATQSIAVLSSTLSGNVNPDFRLELNFIALSMWLWGGMLYIWMMSLIFYRYTFYPLAPGDLAPPYWINMGAMAISTLVGTLLIDNAQTAPYLWSLLPFLKGFTIFYWATATWWIPMLIILAWWRHIYKKYPLRYDPLYWGAVFPLGMYPTATLHLARTMDLDFLSPIPIGVFWVAMLAWVLAFGGLLGRVWGLLSNKVRP